MSEEDVVCAAILDALKTDALAGQLDAYRMVGSRKTVEVLTGWVTQAVKLSAERDTLFVERLVIRTLNDLCIPSATLSDCGRYRYTLQRPTGIIGAKLAWLMLNPSTADATVDDPTIRKVIGFTRRAGYGTAVVVNLFAWRATDPRDVVLNLADAQGAENYAAIMQAVASSAAVVCAWGNEAGRPWVREQRASVLEWLTGNKSLLCLGRNKDGSPLHPLMPSYDGHPLVAFVL